MRTKVKFNQIFYKIIAAMLLFITLFMYSMQSLAAYEGLEQILKDAEEARKEDDEKGGGTGQGNSQTTGPSASSGDWANPFEVPQYKTYSFGPRSHPVHGGPDHHSGVDLSAAGGTPILAPSDGTVIVAGWHDGYGYHVEAKRDDGYTWLCGHMVKAPEVVTGDTVKLGEIIGFVGTTGMSSGNHLHLEIRKNGTTAVDPELFVDIYTPGISKGLASSSASNSLALVDFKKMMNDGDFYYKGIPEGHFMKGRFNPLAWVIENLKSIVDYLLGVTVFLFNLSFLGWASIVEKLLTDSLDSLVIKTDNPGNYRKSNVGFYTDSKRTVNVENIFFNRVEVLNVNFFESKESVKRRHMKYSPSGIELAKLYGSTQDGELSEEKVAELEEKALSEMEEGPMLIIKDYFAMIFIVLYSLGIALMLGGLIVSATLASIESVGAKKATYKERTKDWLRALIELVGVIFYMVAILQIHTWIISMLSNLADSSLTNMAGNYVQTDMGRNYTIMETLRTRAYSLKFSVSVPATIMYMVLIWYTIKFFLMYVKRFLVLFFLSVLGPILMVYDLFMKTVKGKSDVRMDWIKEYTFNVLIQGIHAFIYLIFIPITYNLASASIMGFVVMFILLKFLLEAEGIVRQIFNIQGARNHSTLDNVTQKSSLGDYMGGFAVASFVGKNSIGMKQIKKHAGTILKPLTFTAGRVSDAALRGGYNLRQKYKESRVEKDEDGEIILTPRQLKRQEKLDKNVSDVLRLKGYNEEEIKERMTPGSNLSLTDEEKDRIRLLEVAKARRVLPHTRLANRTRYTANRYRRVLKDMSEVDDKGRRRIKSGMFDYDDSKGKIVFKDSLHDKFKKSVIKEFDLGKGSKGKEEYDKAVADIKTAASVGAKSFIGIALFPISLVDSTATKGLTVGLKTNFQFNSKILGKKDVKRRSPGITRFEERESLDGYIESERNQKSKKPIQGPPRPKEKGQRYLTYGGRRQRGVHNIKYRHANTKRYNKEMK